MSENTKSNNNQVSNTNSGQDTSVKVNRREFLFGLSASAGTLLLDKKIHFFIPPQQQTETVKALVIGTGFGGAIAALRLARAGVKTVVLERGIRWPITKAGDTFATTMKPDGRSAWLNPMTVTPAPPAQIPVFTGVLEGSDEDGIRVLAGAGVGGGSLVYNGIMIEPPQALFNNIFPQIDYQELTKMHFPTVRRMLNISKIPDDILADSRYTHARVELQQSMKAGFTSLIADSGIDWKIVRKEIKGKRVPSVIIGEGIYGNNSGAKNSVDRNYLAAAEASGMVDVRTLHVVTDISEAGQGYMVNVNIIDTSGKILNQKTFICQYLFLAAGSLNTSKLLVKAREKKTLPSLNDQVGLHWGNNGDGLFVRPTGQNTGAIQAGGIGSVTLDNSNSITPVGIVQVQKPFPDECQCVFNLGTGIPNPKGFFVYNPSTDSVKLTLPQEVNSVVQSAVSTTINAINQKNGLPTGPQMIDGRFTIHPLGGAVLGKACDMVGRLIGYKGLYVVDSSLIPGSVGAATPALTIAALAERAMSRIIAEDKIK